MAEEETAAQAGKTGLQALTRKIGPLPLWIWAVAAVGIWWYVGRGKSGSGQQTDPAGNVGVIDPATGYVYGSPQDQQALTAQRSTSTDSGSGSGGSTTAGGYADDEQWASAAINYLVARGIDPTSANEAIRQYLGSQQLTPDQQGMVNLAIQGIGPPPQLPGPVGTPPPPVVTPPKGTVYATNPPSGFTVTGHTGNTVTVKWNRTSNATGYTVRYGRTQAASDGSVSVGSNVTTATVGGLTPNTYYYLQVQATPAKSGAGYAQTTVSTGKTPVPPPPPGPTPPKRPPGPPTPPVFHH